MNKQMKEVRKRVQATLDEECKRAKQGPWDYDVDAWIECLEGVLWQIDWVLENIKDEEEGQ